MTEEELIMLRYAEKSRHSLRLLIRKIAWWYFVCAVLYFTLFYD